MTTPTWYHSGPGATPGPSRAPWAFTVRPDLWPPGWVVWATGQGAPGARYMTFWDWEYTGPLPTPDTRYSDPGVAEALILAGQVRGGTVHRDLEWVVQGSSRGPRVPYYQLMDAKKHANRGHEPTTGYKPTGYARKAAAKVAKAKVRAAKKAERAWAIRDQG